MNIAVAVSPLLDGRLQRRAPSNLHSSVGWKLGALLRPTVGTSAQAEIATACGVPDGPDAALSSSQSNKATVSGVVEHVVEGFDEQNNHILQVVLRVEGEDAPLLVRTRLPISAERLTSTLSRKDGRRLKKLVEPKSKASPGSDAVTQIREYVNQFVGKGVLVEGSVRLKPQVDQETGAAHYLPVLVVPEGEIFLALTRR